MRAIEKQTADRHLVRRHQNPPETAEEATKRWGNFRGDRKRATLNKCVDEQYGLCGYSEIALDNTDLGMHLDHVEPKHLNPARTFDHDNLIVSAIDDIGQRQQAGKLPLGRQDVFGGQAKGAWFHAVAFIHPLLAKCQAYFHYQTDGRVVPKADLPRRERAKARLTIYRLNLNAPILVNRRKTRLAETDNLIQALASQPDKLLQLAQVELLPEANRLRAFHSGLKQLFGKLAKVVLCD